MQALQNIELDNWSKIFPSLFPGNNRLMKMINELDEPSSNVVTKLDPSCPALWRNRKKITIEHLSFKYQEYSQGVTVPTDKCEVLDEFLKKVMFNFLYNDFKCNVQMALICYSLFLIFDLS